MTDKKIMIRVEPDLHRQAKVEAAKRGTTISAVLREALLIFVGRKPKDKPKQ